MKKYFIIILLTFIAFNGFCQDYTAIYNKEWRCIAAKSSEFPDSLTKSWYVGSTLTLKENGVFIDHHVYATARMSNRVVGKYEISPTGLLCFKKSTLTTIINGRLSKFECLNDNGNGGMSIFCILNRQIVSYNEKQLTLVIPGSPNSEATEDTLLTYSIE